MQRRHRLTGNKEFQDVRNHGRSWSNPLLVLRTRSNGLAYSRFGFVVSKRIGKAVVRNLIKRRLREATRVRLPRVATGWDVVLIARQSIVDARFSQIERALDSLLTQAGLYEAARELPDVAT